jgi:hypothetical protein
MFHRCVKPAPLGKKTIFKFQKQLVFEKFYPTGQNFTDQICVVKSAGGKLALTQTGLKPVPETVPT